MNLKTKYILTNVNIIDGTGKEPAANQSLMVADGVITRIEATAAMQPKEGYQVVDMKGHFVMPGLIDAHIHLCGAKHFGPSILSQNIITSAYRALVQTQTVLRYGITSVRDLSRSGLYLKRVLTEGTLIGPRIVSVGPGISPTGGPIDAGSFPIEFASAFGANSNWGVIADSDAELQKTIRMLLREGADQIKFFANGAGGTPIDRDDVRGYTFGQMKLIVDEAKRVPGTMVMSHVCENATAWDCLKAGVDTFEHIGYLDENLCEEMVKQGRYLVPTVELISNFYSDFSKIDESGREIELLAVDLPPFYQRDAYAGMAFTAEEAKEWAIMQFQMAHKKGVKIAVGSDCIDEILTPYGEYTIKEILAMVEYGMTPLEAINAATQMGAEVLGVAEFTGTIEKGKFADMVITANDPTSDLGKLLNPENIAMVILNGDVVAEKGKLNHPL